MNKVLLFIFAMIAGILINFFPGKAHAAVTPSMDWYDQVSSQFVNKPTKDEIIAWLQDSRQQQKRIYLVNSYSDWSRTVQPTQRTMELWSMDTTNTMSINGDVPICYQYADTIPKNQYCAPGQSAGYYDTQVILYGNKVNYMSRLTKVGTSLMATYSTGTEGTSQWGDGHSVSGGFTSLATKTPESSYHPNKLVPTVSEVEITNSVWGSNSPVGNVVQFNPADKNIYASTPNSAIFIRTTNFRQISFTVDGAYIDTLAVANASTAASDTLVPQNVLDKIKVVGKHTLYLKTWLSDAKTDVPTVTTFEITYADSKPYVPPSTGGGSTDSNGLPIAPSAPQSGWDLIGWLKYLVDWVLYIVNIVIYLLAQAGGRINDLFQSSSGFISAIKLFFGFLPPDVNALLGTSLLLVILLRIFKR